MAITKFDLYNPEWLELVFDSRNKDYGAYDLRKHYAGNLVKAMAIAFFSVAFLSNLRSCLHFSDLMISMVFVSVKSRFSVH